MVTGQDVKSGYGQKSSKPHTSVLPYLRAQQAEKDKKADPVNSTPNRGADNREKLKTTLKHIHPSATEAELETMVDDM